jgi:hypothetical protein
LQAVYHILLEARYIIEYFHPYPYSIMEAHRAPLEAGIIHDLRLIAATLTVLPAPTRREEGQVERR